MCWFKKSRTVNGVTPTFLWTRCRRCHSYECETGSDVLIIDATKCTPSAGQWYAYRWEIRLDGGESITGGREYREDQIPEAKFDAEWAYLKWKGIR